MSDLVEFLRARLDEDKQAARGADAASWTTTRDQDEFDGDALMEFTVLRDAEGMPITNDLGDAFSAEDLDHIARHDPARVLREVEAKRQIMQLHRPVERPSTGSGGGTVTDCPMCDHFPAQYPCTTIRLLALPYEDHPDYDEKWKP